MQAMLNVPSWQPSACPKDSFGKRLVRAQLDLFDIFILCILLVMLCAIRTLYRNQSRATSFKMSWTSTWFSPEAFGRNAPASCVAKRDAG
jgi:hypothetical protein